MTSFPSAPASNSPRMVKSPPGISPKPPIGRSPWDVIRRSSSTGSRSKSACHDRFISGSGASKAAPHLLSVQNAVLAQTVTQVQREFMEKLADAIFEGEHKQPVLNFKQSPKNSAKSPVVDHEEELRRSFLSTQGSPKCARIIANQPIRILDAPSLYDDFYLNLLHWSETNVLAVALGQAVYLWAADTGAITCLFSNEAEENYVSSVRWMPDGSHLAVGNADNSVKIYETAASALVRTMQGHASRVGALDWANNAYLTSGSKDSRVLHHDVRIRDNVVSQLTAHSQEVCGLRWSPDGITLASGSNGNDCFLFDRRSTSIKLRLKGHRAAVKAFAWNPTHPGLLATGAGTQDRHLRFFNTTTGACMNAIDTKSQVCSIEWSKNGRELVSAHGFSDNQLTVWRYPSLQPIATLTGHARVLFTAMSPDGSTVVSAAADETLRFLDIWDPVKRDVNNDPAARSQPRFNMTIR